MLGAAVPSWLTMTAPQLGTARETAWMPKARRYSLFRLRLIRVICLRCRWRRTGVPAESRLTLQLDPAARHAVRQHQLFLLD